MNRKIIILVTLLVFVSAACSQTVLKKGETVEFASAVEGDDWSEPLIVTSQNPKEIKVGLEDGGLKFDLNANESYVYKFYNKEKLTDVTMEAEVENLGLRNNGIAFVCRANDERTEWIEFRVTNQGRYDLYHYNAELRNEYKNPYEELIRTGTTEVMNPIKNNVFKVTCDGNTFSLMINDQPVLEKEIPVVEGQGGVAVGAMAFDQLPVSIVYQYVNFRRP